MTATFAALRTVILISFGNPEGEGSQTHIFEVDQGLDCEKIYLVEQLCQQLSDGECSLTEAQQRLEEIRHLPARYNDWIKILCNGFAAAAIAPLFFRSGWGGVAAAFVLGTITGILLALGDRYPRLARVLVFMSFSFSVPLACTLTRTRTHTTPSTRSQTTGACMFGGSCVLSAIYK